MPIFFCERCHKAFEALGEKREFESKIFGKLWKLVAKCPHCQRECEEWRPQGKKSESSCSGSCSSCSGCAF